jgi:hypothetical protein
MNIMSTKRVRISRERILSTYSLCRIKMNVASLLPIQSSVTPLPQVARHFGGKSWSLGNAALKSIH